MHLSEVTSWFCYDDVKGFMNCCLWYFCVIHEYLVCITSNIKDAVHTLCNVFVCVTHSPYADPSLFTQSVSTSCCPEIRQRHFINDSSEKKKSFQYLKTHNTIIQPQHINLTTYLLLNYIFKTYSACEVERRSRRSKKENKEIETQGGSCLWCNYWDTRLANSLKLPRLELM